MQYNIIIKNLDNLIKATIKINNKLYQLQTMIKHLKSIDIIKTVVQVII